MGEADSGDTIELHTINAQLSQPAITIFNLQVLHCMLLLPDNPTLFIELGHRSAVLHALLHGVVAAFA